MSYCYRCELCIYKSLTSVSDEVVFLWCEAKNTANIFASSIMELILVVIFCLSFSVVRMRQYSLGLWGKVGGLLHRSRENAAFSAIIPEFCSVSRGVLQRLTSPKNKKKGLPFSPPFCCLKVPCGIMQTPPLSKR